MSDAQTERSKIICVLVQKNSTRKETHQTTNSFVRGMHGLAVPSRPATHNALTIPTRSSTPAGCWRQYLRAAAEVQQAKLSVLSLRILQSLISSTMSSSTFSSVLLAVCLVSTLVTISSCRKVDHHPHSKSHDTH